MTAKPPKPSQVADAAAEEVADEAHALARAWWRRVPQVLRAPRAVFVALAETDELDLEARSEPVLALTILAGVAGVLLTPAWGSLLDDPTVDSLVIVVLTFVAGVFYGAAGALVLGLALWLGVRAVGVDVPLRLARQVVVFAATPLVLSLVVTVPSIVLGFGGDWFRSGGADDGAGRAFVTAAGLAFAVWGTALVIVGLRETFRLPWRGVAGAAGLAGVLVAALAMLATAAG